MVQNTHEMLPGRRRNFLKLGTASAALAAGLLAASASYAQEPPITLAQAQAAPAPAAPSGAAAERPANEVSTFVGSLIPGFQFDAGISLSETYATNAVGFSGGAAHDDWITLGGINLNMHDHSRRVSFDASYNGQVYYYARGAQPTQYTNDLQALATVVAVPDYLNFVGRAFAQPVVISNSGSVTANGITGPNGYRNGYGYSAGPDITFHLGDFASSDTLATYGGAYFTDPNGTSGLPVIPGVSGPENTIMRSVNQTFRSGPDFTRLQWTVVGVFSETDRSQGLFSEKAGVGTLQYAITREISLLGTGGYDKITNSTRLTKDVSGPVGMGGVSVTLGEDFSFQAQVGEKYNDVSFLGSLRWNIGPSSVLTGSATDSISTPEGQLLNNLTGMTASLNGNLTTASNIYSNGSTASLANFSAQSLGSLSFNQNIARYQMVTIGYSQDFERDHANVSLFGQRLTNLDGTFVGPPVTNSWGGQASYSHDISRLTSGTLGFGYGYYQELGGHSTNYNVSGQIDYSLGPDTRVYFRSDYYTRNSSQSLQTLSPLTGSLDDFRLTLGLNHQL